MSLTIDTESFDKYYIRSFDEKVAKEINKKGWSFSYVYNFSELRDIYLVLREKLYEDLPRFTKYCLSINLPFVKTTWNKRRILEHLNALKNFDLIDEDYRIKEQVFDSSQIGDQISTSELSIFRKIYFSYFRFKEIFSWLVDISLSSNYEAINQLSEECIIEKSRPLFLFSEVTRFTDSFFYELSGESNLFRINHNEGEDLMRFWDVFVKWGTELGVLEKFNLRNLGIKTVTNRSIACCYITKKENSFCLLDFLNSNYDDSYIYLPSLILDISLKTRMPVEHVKSLVIKEYKKNKEVLSFERTSEIFVKKQEIKPGDKIFYPKYNDSFVSHLIIRR